MRHGLTIIAILLLAGLCSARAEDDRCLRHSDRLNGLDLDSRVVGSAVSLYSGLAIGMSGDLRISASATPARFNQNHAQVVQAGDGRWWVVWDDDRFGSRKILRQIFDSAGQPVGSNDVLAGSDVGANFTEPRLAVDTLGRVYLGYRDQTAGLVYATRYLSTGETDLAPFLVNDTTLNSFAGPFDMTVFADGQLVVVWENYAALGSTIEMHTFTPSGASQAGPMPVNADGGSANHWVPAIAHAPGSGFLVVWEDYRNGPADIYGRQFTGGAVAIGGDFQVVPPPANNASQNSPKVTYSSTDRYVIGWVDRRDGQEIYLQRYDQTVGLVDGNQLVSSGLALVLNRDLDLSASAEGKVHAVWSASGADNTLQSLVLDSGLVPAGLPEVMNLSDIGQRWGANLRYGTQDDFVLVWTETIADDPDIAFMLFDSQGDRQLVDELVVNDDQQGAHSTAPQIIPVSDWRNLVGFVDSRRDAGDIYVRLISNAGTVMSGERRVNQDAGASLQSEPQLAASDTRVLIVWNDARTLGGFSGQRIYGRFCSLGATLESDEFVISDAAALAVKGSPRVALTPAGVGLTVWLDRRDGTAQVYGRWLATNGNLDGDEFLLSQPGVDLAISSLSLGIDAANKFNVIWFDAGSVPAVARVDQYDDSQILTASYEYSSSLPGVGVEQMVADVAPDGVIALFWTGIQSGSRKAFLTRLTSGGVEIGNTVEIADSPEAAPSDPAISVSNNGYVGMTWIDRRAGRRLAYYQVYALGLGPIAANQPVASFVPEYMAAPTINAYRGRAWFAWADPREEGLNIWANTMIYLPTDVEDNPTELPSGFSLSQNYPNPFNPTTEIEYSIASTTLVKLSVINSLGQTVAVLVNSVAQAGEHRVVWNGLNSEGRPVASGVYLYRLMAGDQVETRKMMLLK